MGCCREKWYAFKVWAETDTIEYEDTRGKFTLQSNIKDINGLYLFYVRTNHPRPLWYGRIVKIEFLGEV